MTDERVSGAAGCPDAETLAQYVDGTLEPQAHADVQAHLAGCGTCFELVAETARAVSEEGEASTGAPPAASPSLPETYGPPAAGQASRVLPFRRRVIATMAAVGAIAATILVVVRAQPEWWQELRGTGTAARLAALRDASGAERTSDGRLSGFDYAPLRSPMRSGRGRGLENLALLAAAREVEEAVEGNPSAANRHAWGVAQLLISEYDGAVQTLETVAGERPDDPRVLNDLAAAYLARGVGAGRPEDLAMALDTAERALRLNPDMPEAWFNTAVILESQGQVDRAAEAWREVLIRDQSRWREEAERRLAELLRPGAA